MSRKRRGRGEGSIFQRGDGTWCASVSAGYNAQGKRRRKVVYGATKGEVQEKLRGVSAECVAAEPSKLTVATYLTQWLTGTAKAKIAPTTYARYEQVARLQVTPYVGHVRLEKLMPLHVVQLFADLERDGVSPRGRQMAGVLLHTALRDAVRLKLLPYNPVSEVAKPRPAKKEMQVLDAKQAEALLKAAAGDKDNPGDRLEALYSLALATGMREGELFALAWSDIDFDGGSVQVQRTLEEIKGKLRLKETKSAKGRRRIDLPRFAVDALNEHRKRMLAEGHATAGVFCDTDGGYLRQPNVQRRSFAPLLKRAGLSKIRFHDLRHTAASLLLLQGVHPKIVSERLGHASIEITLNTYSHVLPTLQREAADKLDRMFG